MPGLLPLPPPFPWLGAGTPTPVCTLPLARGGRNCRAIAYAPASAEKRVVPHRLQSQKQNPSVLEESKLRFLPSHELAMKLPGPGSHIFTAGDVRSRRTAA